MARFRPFLMFLCAAVLLLQSGLAVAHCFRGMGADEDMLVEICSAEGMRTIWLDAQGEPRSEHAPRGEGGFCPLCHGLPGVTLPEPPSLAAPAWYGTTIACEADGIDRLRPPARAPPYATRAPPIPA